MVEPVSSLSTAFLTFLREGQFYGVSLGMRVEEVVRQLGPEQKRWETEYGIILHWNNPPVFLEFDVETQLLWSQQINLWQPEILIALFDGLTEFSPSVVAQYLQSHAISFEVQPTPEMGENDIKFRLPHAIEFSFFDDPEEGRPLELRLIDQTNTLLPHLIVTRQ